MTEISKSLQTSPEYNTVVLQDLRRKFKYWQLIPELAADRAFRYFIRPDPMPLLKPPSHGAGGYEMIDGYRIYVHEAGEGPAALLVHGWESSVGAMRPLFDRLVARGYRVVVFDLPGHGQSSGTDTDIATVSRIIRALADRRGPFAAAIGHSFGGLSLARALREGLSVQAAALLASPASFVAMMDRFAHSFGLRPGVRRRFEQKVIDRLLPFDIRTDFEADRNLADCRISLLLVHDRTDPVIDFAEAEELAAALPQAQFLPTEGYGHSALTFQPEVIRHCLNFLKTHLDRMFPVRDVTCRQTGGAQW